MSVETSTGCSKALKAERRTRILKLSIRHIQHGILDLYPYKTQALHMLLPEDTDARQNFATWELAQMEFDSQWLLNFMWTDETHFSLHGDVNSQIWVTSNPREFDRWVEQSGSVFSSYDCLVWFYWVFYSGPFSFEEPSSASGRKTCSVTAKLYLTPLSDKVVPAFTFINCCHLHAGWCPASHCTRRQDVPVGIIHRIYDAPGIHIDNCHHRKIQNILLFCFVFFFFFFERLTKSMRHLNRFYSLLQREQFQL